MPMSSALSVRVKVADLSHVSVDPASCIPSSLLPIAARTSLLLIISPNSLPTCAGGSLNGTNTSSHAAKSAKELTLGH